MNLSAIRQAQKQLQKLHKELGLINGFLYLVNRLADFFSLNLSLKKYYFVAQYLSEKPALPQNKGHQYRIIELLAHNKSMQPNLRPEAVIADRYKQGAVCLAAYKEEEFAGCLWYVKSRYQEDEVRCLYELPSNQTVWDFDVYVEPKFRLSPVFLKLWDTSSAKLLSEGYNCSLSRISAFNAMSLSSHKRMGAKIIGWAFFLSAGSVQLSIASLNPFVHISFSSASFPTFKLQPPQP